MSSAGQIRFIDWEYAACGEPCFDLAVLIQQAGLDDKSVGELLEFADAVDQRARLDGCRRLYDRLAALWLIVVCQRSTAPAVYRDALMMLRGKL